MFTKIEKIIQILKGEILTPPLEKGQPLTIPPLKKGDGGGFLRLPRILRVLAMTVITYLSFTSVPAYALSQDEAIDLAMNAIEGPVFHRTLVPYGTQEGAPLFPIYKQQPPAAQQDFRPPPPPPAVPVETPAPEPGIGTEPSVTEPTTPTTPTPCVIKGKPC